MGCIYVGIVYYVEWVFKLHAVVNLDGPEMDGYFTIYLCIYLFISLSALMTLGIYLYLLG